MSVACVRPEIILEKLIFNLNLIIINDFFSSDTKMALSCRKWGMGYHIIAGN